MNRVSSGRGKFAVGIGTANSGLLLVSDHERKKWKKIGPFLRGESVNCIRYEPKSRQLFAATHTDGVFVSKDFGRTWKQSNKGLHVKKAWTLEFERRNPRNLYVGTQYGHLFKSSDLGSSWEEVTGLFDAPKRKDWGVDWGFGTVGLCIHTIRMDPSDRNRFYFVSSGAGPYRTDDGGKTWSLLNKGVKEKCSSKDSTADVWGLGKEDPSKNLEMHLEQVHKCTHKLAVSERNIGTLYQQNHCGVYKSSDSGESWEDISPSDETRHGFPLALIEGSGNGGAIFTIPAPESCKKHNSCIQGELAVYRSENAGKSWERLSKGLGKKNHTCVLRDAMATDLFGTPGLYFGTTTGEVYGSTDLGDSFSLLQKDTGRVQGISTFEF
ncbi:MAG TPA: hypothetical protein VJN71_09260 [Nitrososphaerales archaeon]|nr:hypothetical protein [Nitrososphaerales archaeon]